jgi:ADP-ribose pyrophosphatase
MKEKQVFNGRLLKVFVKPMRLPNGYKVNMEYIKHPGAVLVLPLLDDGRIVMIRQFRAAIGKYILELPAGTLERGESLVSCVKRELIEETGYSASKVKKLGEIVPVPGYSTEVIHIFLARGLKVVPKQTMPDEVIKEQIFSGDQIMELLKRGKIIDAKTICGLSFFACQASA